MTKLWVNLFMLNAKAVVNAYTWTTLPFYTIAQRPWRQLRLSKSFGIVTTKDSFGRVVYSRPCLKDIKHPLLNNYSLNEIESQLDRNRKAIGIREVLTEKYQLDVNGNPIKIDGKVLKLLKLAKEYRWYTVQECFDKFDSFARGLNRLGVSKGKNIIIYADNSFEWIIASLALSRLNATLVTLLSILNDEGVQYGINQCEGSVLMTSEDLLPRLARISSTTPNIKTIIYWKDKFASSNEQLKKQTRQAIETLQSHSIQILEYDKVMEEGEKLPTIKFEIPNLDDVALIMYTSGTTGNPKGVILTHRQLGTSLHNLLKFQEEMNIEISDSIYAAYLPMAHLYGFLFNLGCFFSDCSLAICSSLTMLDNLPSLEKGQVGDFNLIKPKFISTVPLVLDRIVKEIYRKLESRTPISAPIFTYLIDYKIRWKARGYDTPITNYLVCKKVKQQFGGNLEVMMVGSAPLNSRTQAFVEAALNIKLIQGYGLTEGSVASTSMMVNDLSYGECGVPLDTVKYYLKDWTDGGYSNIDKPNPRGEVVIGGPTIAQGYFKMPKETEECFKVDPDGTRWFETGDIGEVLPNGTLKIIDRKKDLTKLANGEFVSLGKIEAAIRSCYIVENACICTDPYSNFVTALVTLNRKSLFELATILNKQNLTVEQLCTDDEVIKHTFDLVKESCEKVNLAKKEIPKRITLVSEEWTQDNNLLTAAFKMKRKQVNDFYQKQIRAMFDDNNNNK